MLMTAICLNTWCRYAAMAKLLGRKRHRAENTAGVVVAGHGTLLIRHTIFGGLDQVLRRPRQSNDRENTERNGQISASVAIGNRATHIRANRIGNVAGAAAAIAAAALLYNGAGKHDRLYKLDDRRRCIAATVAQIGRRAKIGNTAVTLEGVNRAFTAVKNDLLIQNGNAVKLLRSATDAGLQLQLDEETNTNGVKAAVELNVFQMDGRVSNRCALDADGTGALNDLVAEITQKNAGILKAIPILAGIQDAICLDAVHIALIAAQAIGKAAAARQSVFCHHDKPPMSHNYGRGRRRAYLCRPR